MSLEIQNLIITSSSAAVSSIQDHPILLSTDLVGKIQIVDQISIHPEVGDFQIIAGRGKVWDGSTWIDREQHVSYGPVSFVLPNGAEVWTVYPGWKALHGQVIYCHQCFASKVSRDGGMPGWWVTPNHMDNVTCMICGQTISQMTRFGNHAAFVRKAQR